MVYCLMSGLEDTERSLWFLCRLFCSIYVLLFDGVVQTSVRVHFLLFLGFVFLCGGVGLGCARRRGACCSLHSLACAFFCFMILSTLSTSCCPGTDVRFMAVLSNLTLWNESFGHLPSVINPDAIYDDVVCLHYGFSEYYNRVRGASGLRLCFLKSVALLTSILFVASTISFRSF